MMTSLVLSLLLIPYLCFSPCRRVFLSRHRDRASLVPVPENSDSLTRSLSAIEVLMRLLGPYGRW